MHALAHPNGSDLHRIAARLIVRASDEVQLLSRLTPLDAQSERLRLASALRAGQKPFPRWTYAPCQNDDLRRALDTAERALAQEATSDLDNLYLERVRELSIEAALCSAVGTPLVARLARERFAPRHQRDAREASALCASWLAEAHETERGETVPSDDDRNPESLVSLMRAAVGRLHLPFTVVVQPSLAALAATGDGVILVAAGRQVTAEDSARTVLHEIEGHACPRTRAMGASLALLRAGTARGTDDQEGLALVFEDRAGFLGPERRRQLAARHHAVEAMERGATFPDVASCLVRDCGIDSTHAVLITERVFRGSLGAAPGLGRERVYLECFSGVRRHLQRHPEDEAVLASGQVSVGAARVVRPSIAS